MVVYTVRRKEDGRKFDMFIQSVDLNFDGNYCLRYNIGIKNYTEWAFIETIYDKNEFNERFEIISKTVYHC